jgi:CRP/FNR family transcriptional regulator, anaerobic regulatory protein
MATRISVSPGEDIFQDDERAEFVFGLSEGVVRLFKMRQDGARQIVSLVLPGEFLEMPCVGRHTVSATAVDKVSLHRFRREPLEDYLLSNPKLMQLLVDFANCRLKMAQDQLLMIGKGSAEERVLFFLTSWRNRLAALDKIPDYLPLPMMREDIADFLALTIETVSRTLKRLEKKNLIRIVPKGVVLRATPSEHRGPGWSGGIANRADSEPF